MVGVMHESGYVYSGAAITTSNFGIRHLSILYFIDVFLANARGILPRGVLHT